MLYALGILAFRVLNALTIATFFQPDEYFQSFEPAHVEVYGYGTLTWEWRLGLRGCLVPVLYAHLFRLADLLGIDIIVFCRVFQGFVASLGDWATYKLAQKLETPQIAKYSLLASLFSSFYFFCGTRPFANTFEMVCTVVALYEWPMGRFQYKSLIIASLLAHLAIILRPTNAILWLVLGARLLWTNRRPTRVLAIVIISAVLAVVAHGVDYLLDNQFYGFPVWPLRSFVLTNIGEKVSHYYGVMPFHFYFTSALPILLIGYLPLGVCSLFTKSFLALVVWSQLIVYSFLAHKEVRFIFYLLPIIHILFAKFLVSRKLTRFFPLFAVVNVIVGAYFSFVHQRGVMSVTSYIRANPAISEVSFLMPCHSTPGYTFFHRDEPLNIMALGCEPPVVVPREDRETYVDEADQFYNNPKQFLAEHPEKLAEYIVIFDALTSRIDSVLKNYTKQAVFFNSHFHDDARRRGNVIVYARNPISS